MAEKAAHFSFTSETKPSIFEVIAQNSLNAALHPALRKIAEFLSLVSPKYFRWLDDLYDEMFLVLNGLLQYYYIKNYSASFSEYFYGLQRTSVKNDGGLLANLTRRQQKLSLAFLVLLPYVTSKMRRKITTLRFEEAERGSRQDTKGMLKRLLLLSHSTVEVAWNTWTLINYLRYMADETKSQLPHLRLLGLQFVYADQSEDVTAFWTALFQGRMTAGEIVAGLLQNGLRTSLEIAAFFVQFLQVWNSERSTNSVTALPTVPPPPLDPKANDYMGRCPICLQTWKIPTALPASGYVFCFPCILKHLQENQRCPVTNIPAKPLDIVRLYDS